MSAFVEVSVVVENHDGATEDHPSLWDWSELVGAPAKVRSYRDVTAAEAAGLFGPQPTCQLCDRPYWASTAEDLDLCEPHYDEWEASRDGSA